MLNCFEYPPTPNPPQKKDCHWNQAMEKLLVKFKYPPNEIAEWKISHTPKNFIHPQIPEFPLG